MKTTEQQITLIILEAEEGKEIYNISNPDIYGKTITLGINDSPDNWAERDATIIVEETEDPTLETPNL